MLNQYSLVNTQDFLNNSASFKLLNQTLGSFSGEKKERIKNYITRLKNAASFHDIVELINRLNPMAQDNVQIVNSNKHYNLLFTANFSSAWNNFLHQANLLRDHARYFAEKEGNLVKGFIENSPEIKAISMLKKPTINTDQEFIDHVTHLYHKITKAKNFIQLYDALKHDLPEYHPHDLPKFNINGYFTINLGIRSTKWLFSALSYIDDTADLGHQVCCLAGKIKNAMTESGLYSIQQRNNHTK